MQIKKILHYGLTFFLSFAFMGEGFPAPTNAAVPPFLLYQGRLLDANATPVTTAHDFRFSFWQTADWQSSAQLSDGNINSSATDYADWQEVQTVIPNAEGIFSVQLGRNTALPILDATVHKFLQVEVKASADADTAYELMDPSGDGGANAIDRNAIGSFPYAVHADNAEKSRAETFILDQDDTVENTGNGDIRLQFGGTLGKFFSYDLDNEYFHFNDSVDIAGDLTVSGLINGVNISSLAGGHDQNTDTGTNSPNFVLNSEGITLTLDSAGLSQNRTVTFPDSDVELTGTDSAQVLTNKTLDGDDNTFLNIDQSALKDRDKTLLLIPAYPQMTVVEDGTENLATLKQGYDTSENHHYYVLSSESGSLQDLDLQIAIELPDDFSAWQNVPLQVVLKTLSTDSTENQVDISIIDTENNAVSISGGDDLSSAIAGMWAQKDLIFNGNSTFLPGEFMILNLKLQARANQQVAIAEIHLNYRGK